MKVIILWSDSRPPTEILGSHNVEIQDGGTGNQILFAIGVGQFDLDGAYKIEVTL